MLSMVPGIMDEDMDSEVMTSPASVIYYAHDQE